MKAEDRSGVGVGWVRGCVDQKLKVIIDYIVRLHSEASLSLVTPSQKQKGKNVTQRPLTLIP